MTDDEEQARDMAELEKLVELVIVRDHAGAEKLAADRTARKQARLKRNAAKVMAAHAYKSWMESTAISERIAGLDGRATSIGLDEAFIEGFIQGLDAAVRTNR